MEDKPGNYIDIDQETSKIVRKAFEYFAGLPITVVHSFIPKWHPVDVDYTSLGTNVLAPTKQIDIARDSFHYGVETNQELARLITSLLAV